MFLTSQKTILRLAACLLVLGLGLSTWQMVSQVTPIAHAASTFYIATTGSDTTGDGSTTKPWASTNKAYSVMKGGDTLIIKNGTYNNKLVLLGRWALPPNGTAGAYTTVKGESYGGVILSGLGDDNNGGTDSAISINGSPSHVPQYIQISNIVAIRQQNSMIFEGNHIKLTQVGFEGAGDGNTASLDIDRNASYILVEDCFLWGDGRMKLIAYQANHIVIRRCVARVDRSNITETGDELSAFAIYSSSDVEMQNDMVVDSDHPEFWIGPSYLGGAFHIPTTIADSVNVAWRGVIAYNVAMGFGEYADNNTEINTTLDNCVGMKLSGGVMSRAGDVHFSHCTFSDWPGTYTLFPTGVSYVDQNDPVNKTSIVDSVLTGIKNGAAVNGYSKEDYNVFFNNTSDRSGTATGTHSTNTNPNINYPFRTDSTNAVLHAKASDGGDIGATVMNRMGTDGTLWGDPGYKTLSSTPLWPWPNESVIKQFFASYSYTGKTTSGATSSISGARGFAASGNGLYGGPITLTSYLWEATGKACPSDICVASGATPTPTPAPTTGPAVLTLTKSVDKSIAAPGDTLTYTVAYANTGGTQATNVALTDTIPAGTTYVAASASSGGSLTGGVLSWNLASVSPNSAGSVTFQVTIDPLASPSPTPAPTATATPPPLTGTIDIYADPAGSDTTSCTQAAPCKTISRAVTIAGNTTNKPVQINLADGTYPAVTIDSVTRTAATPLIIKATGTNATIAAASGARGNIHIVSSAYITLDGIKTFNGTGSSAAGIAIRFSPHVTVKNSTSGNNDQFGIFSSYSDYTTLENNETYGSKVQHGIYLSNSSDNLIIRGNKSHDNFAEGIQINADGTSGPGLTYSGTFDGISTNNLVENNISYNNGKSGINFDGVQDSTIRNNVIYNNSQKGITLFQIDANAGPKNDLIYNNTVDEPSGGYPIRILNTAGTVTLRNNVIFSHSSPAMAISVNTTADITNLDSDYNIWNSATPCVTKNTGSCDVTYASWQGSGDDTHSVLSALSSLFVNVAGSDYHLATSSPAIDKGTTLATVLTDLEGRTRPQGSAYDIGAYEK